MKNTFSISGLELDRRISAYTALIFSFSFSILTGIFIFYREFLFFSLLFFAVLFFVLLISRYSLIRHFNQYLQAKIILANETLERITVKSSEVFNLKDIDSVKILRTTRNAIRNINIKFRNGNKTSFDGVENFDELEKHLISKLSNDVTIRKFKEPGDFDHVLFYPILGIILGFSTIFILNVLQNLSSVSLQVIFLLIGTYVLILGVYFILKKPLKEVYGKKYQKTDYIWGSSMVIISIVILIISVFN